MSFNTIPFLAFLVPAVLVYYLLPYFIKKHTAHWQNAVLLAASFVFYAVCGTPGYVVFLLLAAFVTWLTGLLMAAAQAPRRRKAILLTGVFIDLGVLLFFKYNGFFAPQLAAWLGGHGLGYTAEAGGAVRLLLPLGISYYTFQSLGYVLDIDRGAAAAEKNFARYLLYVGFFPQITAGPIGRAGKLLPQFGQTHAFDYATVTDGGRLMLIGYFKKIAVADMLAMVLNPVFAAPESYTGLTLTSAVLLYAMYLYCDFSGYSDIARGCGALFGIRLRENFETPYLSAGFGELWRRWHMSLSSWLRDYVYIGLLGGNRKGEARKYINLFLTFFISGLWHGVGLTYTVWGALQGLFQMVEYWLIRHGLLSLQPKGVRRAVRVAVVFTLNAATLTIFRAASLRDALFILTRQFSGVSLGGFVSQAAVLIGEGFNATPLLMAAYVAFCALGLGLVIWADFYRSFKLNNACLAVHLGQQKPAVRWVWYYLMLAMVMAAFLMQNGNYVGSVSFAYGGF